MAFEIVGCYIPYFVKKIRRKIVGIFDDSIE
jgi:hypothetical protein